tara:strand:+ start:4176 stop:5231 length:1056 start_codon:yes stop_codon:yes gene_type:complete
MPRLLDKIRHDKWDIPAEFSSHHSDGPEAIDRVRYALGRAEAIVVDSVASMYYEDMPAPGIHMEKDCPNSTPPFPYTWVETRAPSVTRIGDEVTEWKGPSEWGMLFVCVDLWEEDRRSENLNEILGRDLRWLVEGTLFCGDHLGDNVSRVHVNKSDRNAQVTGPLGMVSLPVDSTGRFIDGLWSPPGTVQAYSYMNHDDQGDGDWIVSLLEPLWYGLSIGNCSNVDLVRGKQHRSVARRWKRKTGKELMVYRTIHLGGRHTRVVKDGQSGEPSHHVALHLCRGHFRTYTADKPLGGPKGAVGTFWVPSHVRGTKDEGIIVKDYDVNAPASDPDRDGGRVTTAERERGPEQG